MKYKLNALNLKNCKDAANYAVAKTLLYKFCKILA